MIIYIILKLLLGYWLVFKKNWIKDIEKLYLMVDLIIVIIYLIIVSIKGIFIFTQMLLLGFIMLMLFLIYKGTNYIMENNEKILEKIKKYIGEKKQEKIKSFFLKPIVCKIIYYMIWLLPWNIGYWMYFWLVENGWYMRVWITSTRDIIFWKIFKWDSRDFFFKLYVKISNNKINYKIKEKIWKIQEMIYRIMYFLYIIRKALLKTSIKKYIWIRITVYMYLSLFYLYILMEIQYLNKILFFVIILLELLFFYHTKKIIERYENEILYLRKDEPINETKWIMTFLKYPFYIPHMNKWVKNKFIWDKTLGNSVSLNILYKYIIFVNKNTKGYFDKQMNIMTRIYREKYLERKSVLWDVLPRTRYVIISLRNEYVSITNITDLKVEFPIREHNLKTIYGYYLSYYEKTYSKTSLLMLIWMLRVNKNYWYIHFYHLCSNNEYSYYKLNSFNEAQYNFIRYINIIIYIYIFAYDKRLINDLFLFFFFLNNNLYFYNEEFYLNFNGDFLKTVRNELPISEKICGLEDYKKIFKIMGRIMLYEEDALVWNENLQKLLNEFNELKEKNEMIKKFCENEYEKTINNVNSNSLIFVDFEYYKEEIKEFLQLNIDEEWFFNFQDFYIPLTKLIEKKEDIEVIKTFLDDNNIKKEEILNFIYSILIFQHKLYSEHKFYDKGKVEPLDFDITHEGLNNALEEYMKKFKKK